MPANLTPDYLEADARFRAAVTREDKLAALEDMLRVLPRHKGTDKLHADLRARLSKLRLQPRSAAAKGFSHHIPREGAGEPRQGRAPRSGEGVQPAVADKLPQLQRLHLLQRHPAGELELPAVEANGGQRGRRGDHPHVAEMPRSMHVRVLGKEYGVFGVSLLKPGGHLDRQIQGGERPHLSGICLDLQLH